MGDSGTIPDFLPREIRPDVFVCHDADAVARAAARSFVEWAWQAIARHGMFRVALSGGSTPRAFYRNLASDEYRLQVDWAKVYVYWSDERAVPPADPESNYGLARTELLLHVPIPPGNVHRMEADRPEIGKAAEAYEDLLRSDFERDDHGFPRFDLIFLGMGSDGHTASIFPGTRSMRGTSRWVSTPYVPRLGKRRMTLTLPVLNAAHHVLFLVAGAIFQQTPRVPPAPGRHGNPETADDSGRRCRRNEMQPRAVRRRKRAAAPGVRTPLCQ